MQSVIETSVYLADAKAAGMSSDEMTAVVDVIAANPDIGVVMPGCGGARKFRIAKAGGGKSGGFRVITYFAGVDIPAFLLALFVKGEKDNLTQAERNGLAGLTKLLAAEYRRKP